MALQHVDLSEGDSLIVRSVSKKPDKPSDDDLEVLLTIPPVDIYASKEGTYVHFISNLDVCTDGSGDHHGDKTPLNETAYQNGGKYLNADKDQYLVIPPQIRSMVVPTVMGCQGRVTNMKTGAVFPAVVGEIGPKDKTGECAICLAQKLNPSVSANVGDSNRIYLYELWPGRPAVVDGKKYALEPA